MENIQEELNLKVEAMDIYDHHQYHSLPVSDEDCQMMPLINDDDDLDSKEEEDVGDEKLKPKREVYEVEAKIIDDDDKKDDDGGGFVKFPIKYCSTSTTEVEDIQKQVAQLLGLEQDSFVMTYLDADQDLIRLINPENLMDALCVVDSLSASNVLRLAILLDKKFEPNNRKLNAEKRCCTMEKDFVGKTQIQESYGDGESPGQQQLLSALSSGQQQLLSSPSPDCLQLLSLSNENQSPVADPNTTSNPSSGHIENNLASNGKQPAPSWCKERNRNNDRRHWRCVKEAIPGMDYCQTHAKKGKTTNRPISSNKEDNNNNIQKRKPTNSSQEGKKSKVKATQSSIDVMAKVEDIKNEIIELMKLGGITDERIEESKFTLTSEHKGSDISLFIKADLRTAIEDAASAEQPYPLKLDIQTTLLD